ncbi:MAG: hypothetical protein IJ187_09915 [Neisseriaceae bacterium]|nr:hypothetical protein [Neisseriaceae bacterium]
MKIFWDNFSGSLKRFVSINAACVVVAWKATLQSHPTAVCFFRQHKMC